MATSLATLLLMFCACAPSITCRGQLKCEVEEAKLKLSRLESLMKEIVQDLDGKSLFLNDSQNRIEEMTFEMEKLHWELSILKFRGNHHKDKGFISLKKMFASVRLLWTTLRKSNFEINLLKVKAQDADNRLESVTSQVETMAAITIEQWLQIQQLEQALHIAQIRALKAKRAGMFTRCSFLKWVGNLFGPCPLKLNQISDLFIFEEKSAIGFYLSRALHHFNKIFSAIKKYHHELQGFIRHEMERNEYTAPLANEEVVFFVASALFTFPIMGAWMWLSSQFS